MSAVRSRLVSAGYVAGWTVFGLLPAQRTASVFRSGADLAWRRGGRGVEQLRRNLRRVVGPTVSDAELDQLVRSGLRSYARYWLETFRLPRMPKQDVLSRVRTEGAEHLDAADAGGKGVILALPHSGNWDVAGLWLIDRGFVLTTVAERVQPAALFDRFVAYREGLGMEILPLNGGDRSVLHVLSERLRSGGCVCLVAERDLSLAGEDRSDEGVQRARIAATKERGPELVEGRTGARRQTAGEDRSDKGAGLVVDFFDEPARMPPGPALLAATTGAALLPVALHYTDDGWGQWIGAPIELGEGRLRERVQRGTQSLADAFARRIAMHPTDWHMLQIIWPVDAAAQATVPTA